MEIAQLRPGMKRVNLEFEAVEKINEREVVNRRTGRAHRLAEWKISDRSGEAVLTVWDKNIMRIKKGKKYELKNGYTTAFRGELRVNIGKYGELEEKA